MKKIVLDPGDRSFKVRNCVSNQDLLVSFVSITKMKNNKKNELLIILHSLRYHQDQ